MSFNKYRLKGAFHYEWYKTEKWYRYLVNRCVKFCKNGDVLEVGCGDGVLANKLSRTHVVTAIDPDPYGIELAKENMWHKHNPVFIQQGIEDIKTGVWDYLTCLNVVEHLNNPDELRRVIRDHISKGAIITTIDYQGGSLGEDHKFEWTYDEMMDFFSEFNPKGFRYKDTEWIGVEIKK